MHYSPDTSQFKRVFSFSQHYLQNSCLIAETQINVWKSGAKESHVSAIFSFGFQDRNLRMTIICRLDSLRFLCSMAKVSQTFLPCISTRYSPSIIYIPSHRFFKATPTQQMLPRRCCPSPRWHASSESVLLPGKQASRCALRCMDVRSQVGDLHAYLHSPSSLIFACR